MPELGALLAAKSHDRIHQKWADSHDRIYKLTDRQLLKLKKSRPFDLLF